MCNWSIWMYESVRLSFWFGLSLGVAPANSFPGSTTTPLYRYIYNYVKTRTLLWILEKMQYYDLWNLSDDSSNQKQMLNRLSYLLTINVNWKIKYIEWITL
jgi:hypothetical protein